MKHLAIYACRMGRADAPENFPKIRHIALDLLNCDKNFLKSLSKEDKNNQEEVEVTNRKFLLDRILHNLSMNPQPHSEHFWK
jgi:hypothetical protein